MEADCGSASGWTFGLSVPPSAGGAAQHMEFSHNEGGQGHGIPVVAPGVGRPSSGLSALRTGGIHP